jgi:hypothetical protein
MISSMAISIRDIQVMTFLFGIKIKIASMTEPGSPWKWSPPLRELSCQLIQIGILAVPSGAEITFGYLSQPGAVITTTPISAKS